MEHAARAGHGHCATTEKICHPSREAAYEHQKALICRNLARGEAEKSAGLNSYRCDACGYWHVGHRHQTVPFCWHYTVGIALDGILDSDMLKPLAPYALLPSDGMPPALQRLFPRGAATLSDSWVMWLKRHASDLPSRIPLSLAVQEGKRVRQYVVALPKDAFVPSPFLWFSRNPDWEHSVIKTRPPCGRAHNELLGEGLVRVQVPQSVAALRWSDYLERNPTSSCVRDAMARRGDPTEWLATDKAIALDDLCGARRADVQVYVRGTWVSVSDISDEEFERYLRERPAVYQAASESLTRKMSTSGHQNQPVTEHPVWQEIATENAYRVVNYSHMLQMFLSRLSDEYSFTEAERILFEDAVYNTGAPDAWESAA